MVVKADRLSPAGHLERRIKENRAEADRWRAEHGDPAEALGAFLREWIGLEALEETYQEYLEHQSSWLFDDWAEDEDGRAPDCSLLTERPTPIAANS